MPTPWDLPPNIRSKISVSPSSDCWLWTGARQSKGYASGGGKGGSWLAHRRVYELLVAEIPDGLTIDHLCRVKHCVNPRHLEPVSASMNNQRAGDLARLLPLYPCGHPRTGENTQLKQRPSGRPQRNCRTCNREAARRHYEARRAAAA